jgi:hypothetical protein
VQRDRVPHDAHRLLRHAIVVLAYDDVLLLDVTGPLEVFASATRAGAA